MTTAEATSPAEAPRTSEAGRYDAFISYSRHDSAFAVDELCQELRAAGKQVWLDLDITGGANWRDRVRRGIEACKSLIFVVSPASVASDACRDELEDAAALNKLIIPVIYEDVPPDEMSRALTESEWIFLRRGDDRAAGMTRLLAALEADLEWRDQHTRLAGRAREWLDSGRNNSYLLRGADLRAAEDWIAQQEGHREAPTREQAEYITRSRQAAGRRLYTLIGALAVGLVISIGLLIFALIQRSTAVHQSHVAQSRQLASEATNTGDLELASLTALEAYRRSPTFEARSSILSVADSHELGAPLLGHQGGVNGVAYSPDGKLLASASDDGTIRLWNLATRRQILPWLIGHTDRITSIAFSPDGKLLASGSNDKTIRLWSVATHKQIGPPLTGDTAAVNSVAFSPDGSLVVSGSDDNTVRLWSVATGREVGPPLTGHTGSVETVAFSPTAPIVASASDDNTVRFWDVRRETEVGPVLNPNVQGLPGAYAVAFSPDGKMVATGWRDSAIRLWDVRTGQEIGTLSGHTNFVLSVAFSPDGKTLASGSYDHSVRIWDLATQKEIGPPFIGHEDWVKSVAFSPDGTTLASGSGDTSIRLWRAFSQREIGRPLASTAVESVAFSPDRRTIAAGNGDGTIKFWRVDSQKPIGDPITGDGAPVSGVAFSPDGRTLAAAHGDGMIRFWDVSSHRQIGSGFIADRNADPTHPFSAKLAYSPDGKVLAFVDSARVGLVDTSTQVLSRPPLSGSLAVAFSPDGKTLATGDVTDPHAFRLLDVNTGQQVGTTFQGHSNPVETLAFSPDGTLIASGADDNSVRLWSEATHHEIGVPLTGATGSINEVAFSPDGTTIAAASDDGTIRLWDVRTRRELGSPLTGHTDRVLTVAFSPDGHTLASGSDKDNTVRLWTTAPIATYVRQLCNYVDLSSAEQLWQKANLGIPYQPPCRAT